MRNIQTTAPLQERRALIAMQWIGGRPTAPDLGLEPEPWMDEAVCTSVLDDALFYPEKGGTARIAKTICQACPVKVECLTYALEHHEEHGVWGGLSANERVRLRRGAA